MSIANEVQRIRTAKQAIASAISDKGGTISPTASIDTYPDAIRSIPADTTRRELGFTAMDDGVEVRMGASGTAPTVSLDYSLDGNVWWPFVVGSTVVTINQGETVYFRGDNVRISESVANYNRFRITGGMVKASGDVMSLLSRSGGLRVITADNAFARLFAGQARLLTPPDLPATTLAANCYRNMFEGCTYLCYAPDLPATTLVESCYQGMFWSCKHLTTPPKLSATTLANGCYYGMFRECANLMFAPDLPATALADHCYAYMFYGCASLAKAPALPATVLENSCYNSMFRECTSLQTPVALPATALVLDCYYAMFYGCSAMRLSTYATSTYSQEYRIPTSGTGTMVSGATDFMFGATGGTYQGDPSVNTTYYYKPEDT